MAAIIPGLPMKVEGVYDAENHLVAKAVRFKGNELEQARRMQAGLAEIRRRPSRIKKGEGSPASTEGR